MSASAVGAAWVSAGAAVAGVVVGIVAAFLVYRQVRLTGKEMRDSAMRTARDSEERTRPYVGIEFSPSIAGARVFDVVIVNHGRSTARDIRLVLRNEKLAPQFDGDVIGAGLARLMADGFDLPPGARLRVVWRVQDHQERDPRRHMGAPAADVVTVHYSWRPHFAPEHFYADEVRYDLDTLSRVIMLPSKGPTSSGPDAHERNVEHALRTIAAHVAELRR